MNEPHIPATLREAIIHYADPNNCLEYLVWKRWRDGVVCPTCGNAKVKFMEKHQRWQCGSHHPLRQFSIKVGTIFEDSPIGLDKWLPAMWLITNAKNGVSSWEISRALGVSQKTAWFMMHRIRLTHQGKNGGKLSGHVEVDQTMIGGKARNMHASKKKNNPFQKAVVMGVLKRGGEVRAMVVLIAKRIPCNQS
jgi:transposase-like protein